MGRIASATTVYASAYLSEKGRAYLFNKGNIRFDSNGNDLFEILAFGLGDPDTNYATNQRLESGDIPDITGKSEDCIKSTADYVQNTLVYYQVDAMTFVDPQYSTNIVNNILVLNTDAGMPLNAPTDVPPVPQVVITTNPTQSVSATGFGVPGGDNVDTATATVSTNTTPLSNTSLGGGIPVTTSPAPTAPTSSSSTSSSSSSSSNTSSNTSPGSGFNSSSSESAFGSSFGGGLIG
jgi:hypothetical protein